MMLDGLILVIGTGMIAGVYWMLSKVSHLEYERNMWKESAFAVTEMYNNLMLQNRIEEEIHKMPQTGFIKDKARLN